MKCVLFFSIIAGVCIAREYSHTSPQPSHIVDTNISVLQKYLADSHHTPLCVLVRRTGSSLERKLSSLWSGSAVGLGDTHFTAWRLAAVNMTQVKNLPRYLLMNSENPKSLLLRCFLGPTFPYDFLSSDRHSTKELKKWLNNLNIQHEQMVNGGVDMIEASVSSHHFTLVVFPTAHQHHELEQAVFQVSEALSRESTTNVIIIHPSSAKIREIMEKYQVTGLPSVLLIEKDKAVERQQTLFSIHDVTTKKMETDMRARLIPARHFNMTDFQPEVLTVKTSERYRPYIIGFYAHWEKDTSMFLSFLRLAAEEFQSMDASVRFGLVDASRNPSVVAHYMSPGCLHHLPFLALFQRVEGTSSISQTELLLTRPSPAALYSALQEVGLVLTDNWHQPINFQPYGHNTQMCSWREGPEGDMCSADNSTWLFPAEFLSNLLQYPDDQTAVKSRGSEEGAGIPLAAPGDWHTEMKGSHHTTGLGVTISVFVFIQHPCKSCEQNMATFRDIYDQLSVNGSYVVRLVNCSQTQQPCEQHHVTGFPTVLAFRSHSSASSSCAQFCAGQGDCDLPVRQDYHGVLTVQAIMSWIRAVSVAAVRSLHFSRPDWEQRETAQLLATVVPLHSDYLPLPPNKDRSYFYTTQCFRLACERLFGLARCFTVNSLDVPASQFDKQDADLVITQVVFRRRDGIEVTLMQLGKSLAALLEEETDQALHMFHRHHSYNLHQKQKCEEDHGHCTQFLESFTRDHLRLPVTALTSDILHSHNDFLFGKKVPVLLALVEPDNLADITETLENVAYLLYKDVVVATLDVSVFRAWAGSFVPHNYNKLHAESDDWGELSVYPRFCLFYWHDHTKAAFYPPITSADPMSTTHHTLSSASKASHADHLSEDLLIQFVRSFLQDPAGSLIETERF